MARRLRVLVFGGRNFGHDNGRNANWQREQEQVFKALAELHARRVISCVITGGATGADACARAWALRHGVPSEEYRADWKDLTAPGALVRHGRFGPYNAMAGPQRNQRMIDEGKPHCGVAFPGGRGTEDMRSRLDAAGIPVWEPLRARVFR